MRNHGVVRKLAACVLLAAACASHKPAPATVDNRGGATAEAGGGGDAMPADVQALVERWESCQHWAGEEPYDEARAREIAAGVAESCPGNDEARAELERTYADRPAVLARLRALDE